VTKKSRKLCPIFDF